MPDIRTYYYPNASEHGGHDGVIIRIFPEHTSSWVGVFAFGRITPSGVTGVFTTPNPERICVVSKGEGYMVSSSIPTVWEPIQTRPIIDVRPVYAMRIIVFASFNELTAYDNNGLKWKTKRLTWDGMNIIQVTDHIIRGEFFDIATERYESFVVDLETGNHEGGIKDPRY